MTRNEFLEAIKSQRNRYNALYELALHCIDIENPPAYLYTLTEDAAEFGLQLMTDFCATDVKAKDVKAKEVK